MFPLFYAFWRATIPRIFTCTGYLSCPTLIKTELYEFDTGVWMSLDDYPFVGETYVCHYDMVFIDEISSYLVIGGYNDGYLSQIGMLKNGVWSDAGQLNRVRTVSFCSLCFFSLLRIIAPNGSITHWSSQEVSTTNRPSRAR